MSKDWAKILGTMTLLLALAAVAGGASSSAPQAPQPASDVEPPPAAAPRVEGISPEVLGGHPWVIVLCNFSNQVFQPNTVSYYEHMFSDAGAGELGLLDYWHDVSYSALSISGTVVKGWYTLGINRDQWGAMDRYHKIQACADAASSDVNYASFWGVAAIFPEATTTTTTALDTSATTVTVASTSLFPTPPFLTAIDDGSLPNGGNSETVDVTGVSGNTYTIVRAQQGTTAKAHNAGAVFIVPGDLGDTGPGQVGITLGGSNYNLGLNVFPHQINVSGAAHEMGHGFGYNHSRKLSDPTNDYNDCYDLMSIYSCDYTFNNAGTFFGGSVIGSQSGAKGPGLDAINLDIQGWIPGPRELSFDNSSCSQSTIRLHSLGDTGALGGTGYLEARLPATLSFGSTTSDYYTAEYREASGWDRGIPADSVLLHLHGTDGYSYWVDNAGHGGALYPGDQYVDAAHKSYVTVSSTDAGTHTALITLAGCKINVDVDYTGDVTGDFNDSVTLSADLSVDPHAAPIPGATLSFTLGSQGCSGTTDANGHAACTLVITQPPAAASAGVSYAGDSAYNARTASHSFTITKEESHVAYTGALTADYHDPATASAVLTDPDGGAPIAGKMITFALGGIDTCSATTDGSGVAACTLTPTPRAGTVSMVASFAGDADYVPSSDTKSFLITKEETTTTYTGPTVILQNQPVTLSGRLLEDGTVPIAGRTLTLKLGAQSCTGTTSASGDAQCTLTVTVAQGSEPLEADFAGDAYYLPSSDKSKQAIVFAFPSKGAFVLTADSGTGPGAKVLWWGASWGKPGHGAGRGGTASFKGFAESYDPNPPACGGSWTAPPGDSGRPPSTVPQYMGVLVTDRVTKKGSLITGAIVKIVVVKTDPGYAPNPGHKGTGKIVATYCP